jgi:hypothetical protein
VVLLEFTLAQNIGFPMAELLNILGDDEEEEEEEEDDEDWWLLDKESV